MPTTKSTPISTSAPAQPSGGQDHQQTDKINVVPTGAGANTGAGTTRPKTQEEVEADRKYEEAMEEEYAKREGGA
ncbi:hypothetical protein QBC35DRAFT_448942 [Podospora australis]|uniref:Uncharacterized protein n=1 Tax=Podospora australis TaxID=1536484 RepID=A0AAN6WZY2_9PEZI|nr:hypothetical protein QBC35DRAFT_448942 [Podospora australis]